MSLHLIGRARRVVSCVSQHIARASRWLRGEAWPGHLHRVATSPGYAAGTAAVLAGLLGLVPWREAAVALAAALFGVHLRGQRDAGRPLAARPDPWGPP